MPLPQSYPLADSRLIAGEYPGLPPNAPHAADKLGALLDAGVTAFIDLTEPGELAPYAESLAALASERNVEVFYERHAIRDFSINSPDAMTRTLDAIDAHHAAGRNVYVHCWGGIGRTGMTVGCWLVRHGSTPGDALATVDAGFSSMPKRARMPGRTSPEAAEQIRVVREWEAGK